MLPLLKIFRLQSNEIQSLPCNRVRWDFTLRGGTIKFEVILWDTSSAEPLFVTFMELVL